MHIKKLGTKIVYNYNDYEKINAWIANFNGDKVENIGFLSRGRNDFQNNSLVFLTNSQANATNSFNYICQNNLIICCIYLAVQKVLPADWLNDRDQFLYPNALWENDKLFHSDCLAYSLFHGSNNIQSGFGVNHWIPFSEEEVSPKELFKSHFMTDFIAGKTELTSANLLQKENKNDKQKPLEFSEQAKNVFNAGKKLWKYYHSEAKNDDNYLNDASFYDIRRYFQGTNEKTRMNSKSDDENYNELLNNLRKTLKKLGEERIVEKVFEYGFLLR